MRRMTSRFAVLIGAAAMSFATASTAAAEEGPLPETGTLDHVGQAVVGGGSTGSNGGTTATTARTRTFSSAAYVDYKRRGGEPTVAVDRYPFPGGSFRDLSYVSAPEGLPGYSFFWKSEDLGATWRLPQHLPATGNNPGQGIGGGDSHQAIGERTHNVFFVDLPGDCVTFNRSTDLGESFTTDPLGCGLEPGAIDDRQWVDADENGAPGTVSGNVYISFIDETSATLAMARSRHDGTQGTFATDSVCNTLSAQTPSGSASDATNVHGVVK